jgi:hypothetical protein
MICEPLDELAGSLRAWMARQRTHHLNFRFQLCGSDLCVELSCLHAGTGERSVRVAASNSEVLQSRRTPTCALPLALSGASRIMGSRTQSHEKSFRLFLRHSLNVDSPWRTQ